MASAQLQSLRKFEDYQRTQSRKAMKMNATMKKTVGCAIAAYLMASSLAEAITISIPDGANTITLGLSASGAVTDNGGGNYTALTGLNGSLARWNFDSFVQIVGGGILGDYQIDLFYDFDPSGATDLGKIGLSARYPNGNLSNKSWNPGNSGLALPAVNPSIVTPPNGTFNAFVNGVYNFELIVRNKTSGAQLGQSARIIVTTTTERTTNVPEAGATLSLLAIGAGSLCGFGVFNRRKR